MADASSLQAQLDELLLKVPGVSARKINQLHAYMVSDKMFACVGDKGLGLKLPAATATELQFSRDKIGPYAPGGMASTREWVQIEYDNPADVAKDMELVQQSIDYVKKGRR
jgi:predicted DNA-binding protein (MmcQ/YjbR family)